MTRELNNFIVVNFHWGIASSCAKDASRLCPRIIFFNYPLNGFGRFESTHASRFAWLFRWLANCESHLVAGQKLKSSKSWLSRVREVFESLPHVVRVLSAVPLPPLLTKLTAELPSSYFLLFYLKLRYIRSDHYAFKRPHDIENESQTGVQCVYKYYKLHLIVCSSNIIFEILLNIVSKNAYVLQEITTRQQNRTKSTQVGYLKCCLPLLKFLIISKCLPLYIYIHT